MKTMGNYILGVLKLSGSTFGSWGSRNFRELSDNKGLSFNVNGMIYKGTVSVVYHEGSDSFNVFIGNEKHEDIYVDNLAEFIDWHVEKNCNNEQYKNQVNNWFASNEYKEMFAGYEE